MIPQLGVQILKEFGIDDGVMLDPYCGSGSSFTAGIACGITEMYGYDLNPLAVLITRAKFTRLDPDLIHRAYRALRDNVFEELKQESTAESFIPEFSNIEYWFSPEVIKALATIRCHLESISDEGIRTLFSVAFSETVRDCSYVRSNEFKLYRIKPENVLTFNPDVYGVFFACLRRLRDNYINVYLRNLNNARVDVKLGAYQPNSIQHNVVLTSPPYGDSRTTVAYGQFSALSNAWLGVDDSRQIDTKLMGGCVVKRLYEEGVIAPAIMQIAADDMRRAYEVSAFYVDLARSISAVAAGVKQGGKAIYIVGNRTVKQVQLPTDQFIAEQFEAHDFRHVITYQRSISNKVMPSRNSPSNKAGSTGTTMHSEYIVVCEKNVRSPDLSQLRLF